jgi:hypothetical protein
LQVGPLQPPLFQLGSKNWVFYFNSTLDSVYLVTS